MPYRTLWAEIDRAQSRFHRSSLLIACVVLMFACAVRFTQTTNTTTNTTRVVIVDREVPIAVSNGELVCPRGRIAVEWSVAGATARCIGAFGGPRFPADPGVVLQGANAVRAQCEWANDE